jgi:hypothetical protein
MFDDEPKSPPPTPPELPDHFSLGALFDANGVYDPQVLLRRTVMDLAWTADKIKQHVWLADVTGDHSNKLSKLGKVLKDLTSVLMAEREASAETFSLKSPSVRVLLDFFVEKMDQSLTKLNAEPAFTRLFFQQFETYMADMETEVQARIDQQKQSQQEETAHDRRTA